MSASHLLDDAPDVAAQHLADWCEERGEPRFRSDQIHDFLFRQRRGDPATMGSLPGPLREALAGDLLAATLAREALETSRDGTRKLRFRLADGAAIESVWIPDRERGTLCISSQAGCPAGCTFCATGAAGYRRNLRASEIIEQWLHVDGAAREEDWPPGRVTQIVFMGMGEPLLNWEALHTTLSLLTSPRGFGFSPRRVTVSTVGIPPRMEQLLAAFPQVRLALSLHSAVDATRESIIPMNRKYPVAALRDTLVAARSRDAARRVTLEYVHLRGVNDGPDEAEALARFARDTAAHVNLLPFHPFPGAPYQPSAPEHIQEFCRQVKNHYAGRVTIRRSRGLDISGACGQLVLEKLG